MNASIWYFKLVFLGDDFLTKILSTTTKTWFKKAGLRPKYPNIQLPYYERANEREPSYSCELSYSRDENCLSLFQPILSSESSSQLRNLLAILYHICLEAELAFLRGNVALLRWWGRAEALSLVYICLWEHVWAPPPNPCPASSHFRGHSRTYHGILLLFLHSSTLTLVASMMGRIALGSLTHLNIERKCESALLTCKMQSGICIYDLTWFLPVSPISSDLPSSLLLYLFLSLISTVDFT